MADQDYPHLYAALEESADRAQDASVAFETMLGGDKDQLVPVRGFPDQPTLAGRVNVALTEILSETVVDALESLEATDDVPWGVADEGGRMPLHVDREGNVVAPQLKSQDLRVGANQLGTTDSDLVAFAIGDANDNSPFMLTVDGRIIVAGQEWTPGTGPVVADGWTELALGQDDTIVHIGDSYTASHYVVKDKSYLAQLSALSPYRHLNFGVSGNDSLDMQYRIVNGLASTGDTFKTMNARYAFLTSLTNDGAFRAVDQTYYAENIRRLIDTVRAFGTEPVITTEFPANSLENAFLARVAEEAGCAFIDCGTLNREVGYLQPGPFLQGNSSIQHPGSRTGGVFWLPMLDFIDRMPRPDRAIKIHRRRQGFAVSSAADLLYKDRLDRAKRWKELTLFHFSLNPEAKYDEINQLTYNGETFTYFNNADEYQRLAAGLPVAFTDYGLLEITLPGNPTSLEAVELTLGVVGTAQVAVRNYLDVAASMPGKNQGSTPTDATYLSKWDKPRGAWRNLGAYAGAITLSKNDLSMSMTGNTLVVLLTGSFSLNNLKVRYKGRERKSDLRDRRPHSPVGNNLVAQPLCGTTAQQAAWTVTGAPAIVVPIDVTNAPRKPGASTPIDGVSVITSTATLAQAVTLPADEGRRRKYRMTVWARYFPKAFLRPEVYPGLDPTQVIDRGVNPGSAPITQYTLDLRTLRCEMWTGTSYPAGGGAEFQDFAAMQWRPIHFDYDALPYITGNTLNFKLSCPDGEIQVGKVLIQEIQQWD